MPTPRLAAGKLLAIDVALLIPRELLEPVLRLNAALRPPPAGFRFDRTHLPHVTLTQQYVAAAALADVTAEVRAALDAFAPSLLTPAGFERGRTTTLLKLAPYAGLARLHADLMDRLQRFEVVEGDASAFVSAGGEPARAADVEWVRRFREQAAYARFNPHITLGVGRLPETAALPAMTTSRLAICRLGRFCTCREVLAETRL